MSRDAHATSLHLHAPHHADLFEEFCRPPSTTTAGSQQQQPHSLSHNTNHANHSASADNSGMVSLPGHFLPYEEIPLPPELMPLNPEDEDGVVPDMHAAFGILRALGPGQSVGGGGAAHQGQGEESRAGAQREEAAWRDLGMESMLAGSQSSGAAGRQQTGGTKKREGQRRGLLLMR